MFSSRHVPLAILGVVLVGLVFAAVTQFNPTPVDFVASGNSAGRCNVGVISLEGELVTHTAYETVNSLQIAQAIRGLAVDSSKEAVVILINTSGGSAAAAEEIEGAIEELEVPNVAFVREVALSGGYWVAAATDHIIALSTSFVGSVGVTGSYLEETAYNQEEGYTYREITSGDYKDVGNVNKPLTAEDREFLQENVDDLFSLFGEVVKKYRGLTNEQFAQISDGKYYIANKALEFGLIDEVGGIGEVKAYLAERLSKSPDDLLLCEPEPIVQ